MAADQLKGALMLAKKLSIVLAMSFAFVLALGAGGAAYGANGSVTADKIKTVGKEVLDAIPDGGSISYDDFAKKVSAETAELIKSVAQPTQLSRKGDHIVLTCTPGTTGGPAGIKVTLEDKVEFDLSSNSSHLLKFDSIKGIKISASSTDGSGTMVMHEFTITQSVVGDVTFSTKVSLSFTVPANKVP